MTDVTGEYRQRLAARSVPRVAVTYRVGGEKRLRNTHEPMK